MSFDQVRKMAYVGVIVLAYMTSSTSISRLAKQKRVFEPTARVVGELLRSSPVQNILAMG
jgi:hypothetical protein